MHKNTYLYIYMYIFICTHLYIYIYTYIFICIYTVVQIYTLIIVHIFTFFENISIFIYLFLYDVHLWQLQAQSLFYPMGMSTEHSALLSVGVAHLTAKIIFSHM